MYFISKPADRIVEEGWDSGVLYLRDRGRGQLVVVETTGGNTEEQDTLVVRQL